MELSRQIRERQGILYAPIEHYKLDIIHTSLLPDTTRDILPPKHPTLPPHKWSSRDPILPWTRKSLRGWRPKPSLPSGSLQSSLCFSSRFPITWGEDHCIWGLGDTSDILWSLYPAPERTDQTGPSWTTHIPENREQQVCVTSSPRYHDLFNIR